MQKRLWNLPTGLCSHKSINLGYDLHKLFTYSKPAFQLFCTEPVVVVVGDLAGSDHASSFKDKDAICKIYNNLIPQPILLAQFGISQKVTPYLPKTSHTLENHNCFRFRNHRVASGPWSRNTEGKKQVVTIFLLREEDPHQEGEGEAIVSKSLRSGNPQEGSELSLGW